MATEPTSLADRYLLESRIASGGMATVWLARDEVLARPVAVKLLHPHLARGSDFIQRFKQEAISAARLSHPRIVAIFDTGAADSADEEFPRPFIVMEYCSGGTLGSMLAQEGPLDPSRVVAVGSDICDALQHAHRYGIIHRDVKPANILLTAEQEIKVADFGIAKAAFDTTDLTQTGSILGSVTYISPEQIEGGEPDQRSDIYALGTLLYELLAGRPPFMGDSHLAVAMAHVHEDPPSLGGLRAQIPRRIERVVMKALSKAPDQRFSSAEELREALEQASGVTSQFASAPVAPTSQGDTGVQPSLSPSRRPPGYTRNLLPIFAVVAVALLLGLLIPRLLDTSSGGERGSQTSNGTGGAGGSGTAIAIARSSDFDPLGDDEEHSEDVSAASDGNAQTFWTTESYDAGLGKAGVGLLFDLGSSQTVETAVIASDTPGMAMELRAADAAPSDASGMALVDSSDAADEVTRLTAGGRRARYWLVWITKLPASAGSGHISEVRFLGT